MSLNLLYLNSNNTKHAKLHVRGSSWSFRQRPATFSLDYQLFTAFFLNSCSKFWYWQATFPAKSRRLSRRSSVQSDVLHKPCKPNIKAWYAMDLVAIYCSPICVASWISMLLKHRQESFAGFFLIFRFLGHKESWNQNKLDGALNIISKN